MRRELSGIVAAGAFVGWLVLIASPATMYVVGWGVYLLFLGLVGWSALRPRNSGWLSGLVFVLLLAFLPLWTVAAYWAWCWAIGADP
jgi:hypothetical protein